MSIRWKPFRILFLVIGGVSMAALWSAQGAGNGLRQVECLKQGAPGCWPLGVDVINAAVAAPDERALYLLGSDQVRILRRDGATGRLRDDGCLSLRPRAECVRVRARDSYAQVEQLEFSSDGRFAYLGYDSYGAHPGVQVLRRGSGGDALTPLRGRGSCVGTRTGCVRSSSLPPRFVWSLTPDGTAIVSYIGGQVTLVPRDAASGRLGAPGGCVASYDVRGCRRLRGVRGWLTPVLTLDGRTMLVGDENGGVAVVERDRSGALSQVRGRAGCFTVSPTAGCERLRGAQPNAGPIALLDHGRRALLWTGMRICDDGSNGSGLCEGSGGVSVLSRPRPTGAFMQPPGPRGCVARHRADGCAGGLDDELLSEAVPEIVTAPDERTAYLFSSDSVLAVTTSGAEGGLRVVPQRTACSGDGNSCPLRADRLAITRDGARAYLGLGDGFDVWRRDRGSGALHSGHHICALEPESETCGDPGGTLLALLTAANGRDAYAIYDTAVVVLHRGRETGGGETPPVNTPTSTPTATPGTTTAPKITPAPIVTP